MEKSIVRLKSITIENFKNIVYGSLDLENHRKKYKANLLGLYGQNGSGKTALIDTLSLLKYVLCGRAVPNYFADYINVEASFAKLTYEFFIRDMEDKTEYKIVYTFNIRKDIDTSTQNLTNPLDKKYKATVFNENLSIAYQHDTLRQKLLTIINTNTDEIFIPKSKYEILIGKDKKIATDLFVEKKLAAISSRSFVFSNHLLKLIQDKAVNRYYKFAINRLVFFGNTELFIIDIHASGLINMNALPLSFKYESPSQRAMGNIAIPLEHVTLIPKDTLEIVKKIIDNMNIVLTQIVPRMSISVQELGTEILQDNTVGCRIQLISNKNNKSIPLCYESDGIKKIISILQLLIVVYNQSSITVAIDELDAGIFEYLLGELLRIISEKGKGQLIFTSHNLRPLETIDRGFIAFTTTNPQNRYIRFSNVKSNNNLRDFYYRDIILGEQREFIYNLTNNYDISFAFREAGEYIGS